MKISNITIAFLDIMTDNTGKYDTNNLKGKKRRKWGHYSNTINNNGILASIITTVLTCITATAMARPPMIAK